MAAGAGSGGSTRAQQAAAPPHAHRISGALGFLEKHLRKGQGWSWHGEFSLEKPRDAGAERGRECYHRNLISLHTLSAPHLFRVLLPHVPAAGTSLEP